MRCDPDGRPARDGPHRTSAPVTVADDGAPGSPRTLVLLLSASRSGSSLLHEQLRATGRFVTLQGEPTPLVRLATQAQGPSGAAPDLEVLRRLISADAGVMPVRPHDAPIIEDFLDRWIPRLRWQWPRADVDRRRLAAAVRSGGLDLPRLRAAWFAPEGRCWALARLARVVTEAVPAADASFYDLGHLLACQARGGQVPHDIVEDLPYILPAPQRRSEHTDWRERPLLVKGPQEADRVELWRRLYPDAQLRILHLVRHPRQTITSIVSGWRSDFFHAVRLPAPLVLDDRAAVGRERWWWKFEELDDIQRFDGGSLQAVACAQWYETSRRVVDEIEALPSDRDAMRVRYEDIVGEHVGVTVAAILAWLGLDPHQRRPGAGFARIMSTGRPAGARADGTARLESGEREHAARRLSAALGYPS